MIWRYDKSWTEGFLYEKNRHLLIHLANIRDKAKWVHCFPYKRGLPHVCSTRIYVLNSWFAPSKKSEWNWRKAISIFNFNPPYGMRGSQSEGKVKFGPMSVYIMVPSVPSKIMPSLPSKFIHMYDVYDCYKLQFKRNFFLVNATWWDNATFTSFLKTSKRVFVKVVFMAQLVHLRCPHIDTKFQTNARTMYCELSSLNYKCVTLW